MSQWIFIILWLGFMALLAGNGAMLKEEEQNGEKVMRINGMFAFITFLPIIIMAGERRFFADTTAYIWGYRGMPDTFAGILPYMATVANDKGFYLISAVMRVIYGYDFVPYLYTVAFFQGLALILFFRKYSGNYVFSVFLFVASTDVISWMFNGMRQFVAVCIVLLATPLMLSKKHWQVMLIIFLAATMHRSALLMIPLVFISYGEAWNKRTLLFMFFALLAVAFVGSFTAGMEEVLQHTQYKNVVRDYTEWEDDGTHPLRVLVYAMPAILSFFARENIRKSGGILINFCTNMSIMSAGIYLISMATSGIFIGRIPIYCSLYSYILLPWELNHLFHERSKGLVYAGVVCCYLLFYLIFVHDMF